MDKIQRNLAADYKLTREQAMTLAGAASLPADIRKLVFERVAKDHGVAELAALFAQFVGLANSVVANNREALELFGICHADMSPWEAKKLNLPTIWGACNGALIAVEVEQDGLCHGCAFRLASCANQSPSTTCDADYCSHPGEVPFMCHEDVPEDGEPTRACVGFARLRAARKQRDAALTGLDDGPPLNAPRRKPAPKPDDVIAAIRAKAWDTRRRKYGEKGHR